MTSGQSYYDLLEVPGGAAEDEIKRAFRREIAKCHPDEVQHLGREFQDMAAAKTAALTQAYRTLTGPAGRGGTSRMKRDELCVFLMGPAVAPANELAAAIGRERRQANARRRHPRSGPREYAHLAGPRPHGRAPGREIGPDTITILVNRFVRGGRL